MESNTIERINLAVDDILQRCAGSVDLQTGCVTEALAELRQNGWVAGEVDLVQSIVQRIVKEREIG